MFTSKKKKIKFNSINNSLVKDLKINNLKYIVLDDGVDYTSFNKARFKQKNACIYIGSFLRAKVLKL